MINAKNRQYWVSKYTRPYGDPDGPRYADLTIAPKKRFVQKSVRVVSYNIRLSKRISEAIKLIEAHDNLSRAEIMCLQEMTHDGVRQISHHFGYNYVYYPAASHRVHRRDMGNAILSKFPIISDKKIILPVTKALSSRRIAVTAEVQCGRQKINIMCVHKEVFLKKQSRQRQVELILRSLPLGQKHAIVAGDFNTFQNKSLKTISDAFEDEGFKLATMQVDSTYKHWYLLNKKSLLDHIFVKGFHVNESGKVHNYKPSDHLPIWTDLKFS